jgi:hypothetical protein
MSRVNLSRTLLDHSLSNRMSQPNSPRNSFSEEKTEQEEYDGVHQGEEDLLVQHVGESPLRYATMTEQSSSPQENRVEHVSLLKASDLFLGQNEVGQKDLLSTFHSLKKELHGFL